MWDGMNRRKFPRANYKCTIRVKTKDEKSRNIEAYTENVGQGGISVVLNENMELFKDVGLEVVLQNDSAPIRCDGTIVWVVKKSEPRDKKAVMYDIGIEFLNLKEADRKRIEKVVEKILSS